jgi:hypothetical protein
MRDEGIAMRDEGMGNGEWGMARGDVLPPGHIQTLPLT